MPVARYRHDRQRPFEARMMAMAARLFTDYEDLPVSTVLTAISSARATARGRCTALTLPEQVEQLARESLGAGCRRVERQQAPRRHAPIR